MSSVMDVGLNVVEPHYIISCPFHYYFPTMVLELMHPLQLPCPSIPSHTPLKFYYEYKLLTNKSIRVGLLHVLEILVPHVHERRKLFVQSITYAKSGNYFQMHKTIKTIHILSSGRFSKFF